MKGRVAKNLTLHWNAINEAFTTTGCTVCKGHSKCNKLGSRPGICDECEYQLAPEEQPAEQSPQPVLATA